MSGHQAVLLDELRLISRQLLKNQMSEVSVGIAVTSRMMILPSWATSHSHDHCSVLTLLSHLGQFVLNPRSCE